MREQLEKQRTYALVGQGGTGKTMLAESILFTAKATNRLGKIEDGNTVMDYEPEEIKRQGSIQPSFAKFAWKKNPHFLIDTPGDSNFSGDLPYMLTASDAVILTVDAVDGVKPLAKVAWDNVKKSGLPAMAFITKMDRERADFDNAYQSLVDVLGIKPVALYLPMGAEADFKGVVDVLAAKAYTFDENGKAQAAEIPADLTDKVESLRETTIENIAESDEVLMEKYLEEGELTPEEIKQGMRKGVLSGELVPVCVGSAAKNIGASLVLDAVDALFPSPLEHAPWPGEDGSERPSDPDAPLAAFVFKTLADPFAGQLSVIRVLSGVLKPDSTLNNPNKDASERIGQILFLEGKKQNAGKEPAGPGSIVAAAKFKNTSTGDTLCAEKDEFMLKKPELTPTMITYALGAAEKGEEDKVYQAMNRLLDEDVNLALNRDEETGDILLSGMGQLHIETSVEKARRRFKTDIVLKTPKVPYRETIKGKASAQGRYKKQTGGRGQFGDCWIEMEPQPRGEGYQFEDAIVGGVIPRQFIPAVDKGIQEASRRGILAGYPMVDFKIRLYDGSFHSVDSSEMAFKVAGSLAYKKAAPECKPILLEPIVHLAIMVPDEFMGDVIGDLSSRRGKVLGTESDGGMTTIKAHVPMSEVLKYAPDLNSMTGGQGTFTMQFSHYEEAPPQVTEKIIEESKKTEE